MIVRKKCKTYGCYNMTTVSMYGCCYMKLLLLFLVLAIINVAVIHGNVPKNYYAVLDLPKSATTTEIKKKYRQLSKQYHPDVNTNEDAHSKFIEVAEAYDVLSNPTEREKFDRLGPQNYANQKNQQNDFSDGMFDFSPFASMFGRRRGKTKVDPLVMKIYLTLEQLYFGDLLHVTYRRPVLCMHIDDCLVDKPGCGGKGFKLVVQQLAPGFVVQNQIQDDSCISHNKGWKRNCERCPNGQEEMDTTFLSLLVEPGVHTGHRITFEGVGKQAIGKSAGDLIFYIVEQSNHRVFTRKKDSLHMTVELTLLEALNGFEKKVKTIKGDYVTVNRMDRVTSDREVDKFRNKGMPVFGGRSGEFGDLFITYNVKFPTALDDTQRKNIKTALQGVTSWKYISV